LGVVISRELAKYLGIEAQEISFGVNKNESSIFIFDTAMGGAGYSKLLSAYKNEVFDAALQTLTNCDCGKACTRCLIDRETQWNEDKLDRNAAKEWLELEQNFSREIPETITRTLPAAYRITNDLETELGNILNNNELQSLKIFVTNDISKWNPNEWVFARSLRNLAVRNKQISIVMPGREINPVSLSASELATLLKVSSLFSLEFADNNANMYPLLFAQFTNGKEKLYVSDNDNRAYNAEWGLGGSIYEVSTNLPALNTTAWTPDYSQLAQTDNNEIWIRFDTKQGTFSSRQLLNKLCENSPDRWTQIFDKVKNQSVSITYTDRYLNSHLACRLIIDLINEVRNKSNLHIEQITFYLSNNPGYKDGDFNTCKRRNTFLENYTLEILKLKPAINECRIEHVRDLKFENPDFEWVINPDSGIGGGIKVAFNNKTDLEKNFKGDVNLFTHGNERYTVVYKKLGD
jgi:hypothetical protein